MKRITITFIFSICAISAAAAARESDSASISGHVIVTKRLTKKRVSLPAYQLRGVSVTEHEDPGTETSGADEFSRLVIYLEGPGLRPGTPALATLTQKGRHFDPEMLIVASGSTVSFPNADPIFHNVFSLSKAKSFDLGYYPAGQTRTVKFDTPGIVQVYCHLHSDMSAAIVVAPSAWWTRPKPDGTFSLAGIPPGTYELVAWHRSAGFFRRHITIAGGEARTVDFVIPVTARDCDLASATQGGECAQGGQ
jgi:hypothetical protein